MNTTKVKIFFIISFFLLFANSASAASLHLTASDTRLNVDQEFEILIKIDSEDSFINATQATIAFPPDMLEVVSVNRTTSIFSFWVEEPVVSNEEGTVTLIGGTAKGVSGESLQVLSLKFKPKRTGNAEISLSNVVITASDGKGTNVLSSVEGAYVSIEASIIEPIPTKVTPEEPQEVAAPTVVLGEKPNAPKVNISLYPDQEKWYSHAGDIIALWDLPSDVTDVAVSLDDKPGTSPPDLGEGLLAGKTFKNIGEGVWYVHIQFKNSSGWGKETHYRVAIDAASPLPFEITNGRFSNDPTPEIHFKTEDAISGISNAVIFVDGVEILRTTEDKVKLPAQTPGVHIVTVRIFDMAGNSVEDDYEFEILPIESPVIDFVSGSVSKGEPIIVSGKAIPNTFIDVRIVNKEGVEMFGSFVSSEASGNWEMIISEQFPLGNYALEAIARDDRGAQSYPSEKGDFRVRAKVILSVGGVDIGWFEILIFITLIITSIIGLFSRYYLEQQKKRQAYFVIARRDIKKLSDLLLIDLVALKDIYESQKQLSAKNKTAIEHHLVKMNKTIDNMDKYLGKELGKLK